MAKKKLYNLPSYLNEKSYGSHADTNSPGFLKNDDGLDPNKLYNMPSYLKNTVKSKKKPGYLNGTSNGTFTGKPSGGGEYVKEHYVEPVSTKQVTTPLDRTGYLRKVLKSAPVKPVRTLKSREQLNEEKQNAYLNNNTNIINNTVKKNVRLDKTGYLNTSKPVKNIIPVTRTPISREQLNENRQNETLNNAKVNNIVPVKTKRLDRTGYLNEVIPQYDKTYGSGPAIRAYKPTPIQSVKDTFKSMGTDLKSFLYGAGSVTSNTAERFVSSIMYKDIARQYRNKGEAVPDDVKQEYKPMTAQEKFNNIMDRNPNADIGKSEQISKAIGEVAGSAVKVMTIGSIVGLAGIGKGIATRIIPRTITGLLLGASEAYGNNGNMSEVAKSAGRSALFFNVSGELSKYLNENGIKYIAPILQKHPEYGKLYLAAFKGLTGFVSGGTAAAVNTFTYPKNQRPDFQDIIKTASVIGLSDLFGELLTGQAFIPKSKLNQNGPFGYEVNAEDLIAKGYKEWKPGTGIYVKLDPETGGIVDQQYETVTTPDGDIVPKYEIWKAEKAKGAKLDGNDIKNVQNEYNNKNSQPYEQPYDGMDIAHEYKPVEHGQEVALYDEEIANYQNNIVSIQQNIKDLQQQRDIEGKDTTDDLIQANQDLDSAEDTLSNLQAEKDKIQNAPVNDVTENDTVNLKQFGRVKIVDDSDPSMIVVENSSGHTITLGKKAFENLLIPENEVKPETQVEETKPVQLIEPENKQVEEVPEKPQEVKPEQEETKSQEVKPVENKVTEYKKGDRVSFVLDGKPLTGTVKYTSDYSSINKNLGIVASVDVDQVAVAGGVPIGRIETVPVKNLKPIPGENEVPEKQEQQVSAPKEKGGFDNWFKDSKVVDKDNKPLVVYHGTTAGKDFTEFRPSYAEGWGTGIYFTDNPEATDEYSSGENGRVIPVYLDIKNPFNGDYPGDKVLENTKAWQKYKSDEETENKGYGLVYDAWEQEPNFVNEAIRELGYDGIIADHSNGIEGKEYVVFSKDQIKNAIQNRPNNNKEVIEKNNNVHQSIADYVKNNIVNNIKMSFKDISKAADSIYGGTEAEGKYNSKDLYDDIELGINQYILDNKNIDLKSTDLKIVIKNITELEKIYDLIPTQTKRSEEQIEFQQFSTPPAIAYAAAWLANINPNDIVLEPSAGIGGLAVFAKIDGAKVIVNELSKRRLEVLKNMPFDKFFNENAEQINNILPSDIKPSIVVMNPPFSSTAGRMAGKHSTKNVTLHIEQALKKLQQGGRLVAIVGHGMSDDSPVFKEWWNKIKSEYNVRANIGLSGDNYKKYGTTFDINIVVIDKNGITKRNPYVGNVKDLKYLVTILRGVENDRKQIRLPGNGQNEQIANKPGSTQISETSESKPGFKPAVHNTVNVVGTETQRPGIQGNGHMGEKSSEQSTGNVNVSAKNNDENISGNTSKPVEEVQNKPGSSNVSSIGTENASNGIGSPVEEVEIQETKDEAKHDLGDSIYSQYKPVAVFKGAHSHPAPLCESAAMAAVKPPKLEYKPHLQQKIINNGSLSDAQLEVIAYAGQAHSVILPNGYCKGYFCGDGTGVGKGREIAGIILDNMNQGHKKAVWISKNKKLYSDAVRDWTSVGQDGKQVINFAKVKTGMSIKNDSGILFATYPALSRNLKNSTNGKRDIIHNSSEARIDQIVEWLGKDYDGVIVFDEAHLMMNAVPVKGKRGTSSATQVALAGIELQQRLPKAKICYFSATGATEVYNLAYAERLGLWGIGTPFADKMDFINKVSAGGISAMELVARDMKAMGLYLSRSISMDGIQYETLEHKLTPEQTEIYNSMSEGWQVVLENINNALEETGQKQDGRARGNALGQFWSALQRFYSSVLTSMEMPTVIQSMKSELDKGNAIVLQIVNTNEATQERQFAKIDEDNDDVEEALKNLDLTPRDSLMQYVENGFPVQQYEDYIDDNGNKKSRPVFDSEGKPVLNAEAVEMRNALLERIGSMRIPEAPLELILNTFGPDEVAEITGRRRRVVNYKDKVTGRIKTKIENRTEPVVAADIDAFMDDKKRILIFSDAGGTGKSYHADKTKKNQRHRMHYLVQAGWRAPVAVQGLGRTNRTNQASKPSYILVTTDLKGQKRFISTIARRLDQLGALTKGQRQTGSQGLFSAKDNLESPIAKDALVRFYLNLLNNNIPGINADQILTQMGLYDKFHDENNNIVTSDRDTMSDMPKFLNRILALKSDVQNAIFDAYQDILNDMVEQAIASGTLDVGLENYKAEHIKKINEQSIRKDSQSGAETKYVELEAQNKTKTISFARVNHPADNDFVGFYKNTRSGSIRVVYKGVDRTLDNGNIESTYILYGQTDKQRKKVSQYEFKHNENWVKVSSGAEELWESALDKVPEYQIDKLNLITGVLLPIWDRLPQEDVHVIRLVTDDGEEYLGRLIRNDLIDNILRNLGAEVNRGPIDYEQLKKQIIDDNSKAVLSNGWRISRKYVNGEYRIELTGSNLWKYSGELKGYGLFTEIIQSQTRYFIPVNDKTAGILKSLTEYRPVSDLVAADSTVHSMPSNSATLNGNGTSTKAITVDDLINKIEKHSVPIRKGKFRQHAYGVFKEKPEVIRIKKVNDISTIAHEYGHYLDKKYDLADSNYVLELSQLGIPISKKSYTKKEIMQEGVAEFVRLYITDPVSAQKAAPNFYKYFEDKLDDKEIDFLDNIKNDVSDIINLPAWEQIKNDISFNESRKSTKLENQYGETIFDKFINQWVDSFNPIKKAQRFIGPVSADKDIAIKADLFRGGTEGMAIYNIEKNQTNLWGDKIVGPSLETILKPIKKSEYKDFAAYMIARRAADYEARGLELPESYEKFQIAVQHFEAEYPHFKAVFDGIRKYEDNELEILHEAGRLSEEDIDKIKQANPNHIPLYRILEAVDTVRAGTGKNLNGSKNAIHRVKGGGETFIDPIESLYANTFTTRKIALSTDILRILADYANSKEGLGWLIEKVPPSMRATIFNAEQIKQQLEEMGIDTDGLDMEEMMKVFKANYKPGPNEILIYGADNKPGEVGIYQADPELYKALDGMNRSMENIVLKVLNVPKSVLQAGIVTSLKFILRNMARDTGSALVNSEAGINPFDLLRGYLSAARKDEWYEKFIRQGGDSEWFYSGNRKNIQKLVRQTFGKNFGDKLLAFILHPLETGREIVEWTELGPRIAEYRKTIAKGGEEKLAVERGRNITIDFKQNGYYGKEVNQVIPFFNANIQGMHKLFRNFHDHPVRTIIKALLYVTLPTLLLYALNKDNPNYDSMSVYRKDLFYNIPIGNPKTAEHYVSIPKPPEYGVLFGALFERLADKVYKKNKAAFKKFSESLTSAFGLDLNIQAVKPWYEASGNIDWQGRPIENASDERLSPYMRYNDNTSMLAKGMANINKNLPLSENLKSPKKIDYLIKSYGGNLGEDISKIPDYATGKKKINTENPFVVTPSDYPAEINNFYDEYNRMQQLYNDCKKLDKAVPGWNRKYYERLNSAYSAIKDLKEKINKIENSKNLLDSTKQTLLKEYNKHIKDICIKTVNNNK